MKKIHHLCIQTSCYQESMDFYQRILGFRVIQETPNFHGRSYNTWLELNGLMIELQTRKAGEQLTPYSDKQEGLVHFCLYTEDLDAEYQELKNKGFTGFRKKNGEDIYTVEGGRLLKIEAPEGTIIELRDTWEL